LQHTVAALYNLQALQTIAFNFFAVVAVLFSSFHVFNQDQQQQMPNNNDHSSPIAQQNEREMKTRLLDDVDKGSETAR
jgi:hypothetical protein